MSYPILAGSPDRVEYFQGLLEGDCHAEPPDHDTHVHWRFDWETPAFGGRLKSPHSMDVPFVFDTLGVIGEPHCKPHAQDLADRVSATWASFARNGDPGNKSIPAWPAYPADKRATMVFNDQCQVAGDPDGEARPLWGKIATA